VLLLRVLILGWLAVASCAAASSTNAPARVRQEAEDRAAAALFAGPILRFQIELPTESLDSLRNEPRKAVPANVTIGTQRFERVTIHVKGAAGSTRSIDDNPALTLNFDKLVPGRKFQGLDKLHLNNSVQDPSLLSEQLAGRLYSLAGIPTARASQALVTLDGRDLGLYVLKEGYNRSFLRRNFPDASGNLYDGGFIRDIDQDLERDSGDGPEDRQDLQRLRDAAFTPDIVLRETRLAKVLEIDRFITVAAMQALLIDWDGYGYNRNNYRIYHEPRTGKFTFIPHGMDQLLGSRRGGGMEVPEGGIVARQLFESGPHRERFFNEAEHLLKTVFTQATLTNHFREAEARLLPAIQTRGADEREWRMNTLRWFEEQAYQRIESASNQLAAMPKPTRFNADGVTAIAHWQPRYQRGQAKIETVRLDGIDTLHIAAIARETVSSFRATVRLPIGKYTLTGRLRTRGVEAAKDERFQGGAGMRISGGEHQQRFSGAHDWTEFVHDFQIFDPHDVEFVAELRANAGEVWYDIGSMKLQKR
jgi:spore coat protein CotH